MKWSAEMVTTYWHKQDIDKPLFPDLMWSKPQNKQQAGKLLIIGGNQYGFAAPAEAYGAALAAGIGLTRVLLPQAVKKVAGALLPSLEYAPNTPSGSFSQEATGEFLLQANWADSVLVTGDMGRNSETAILLESFLAKHTGQVALTKDAADYCLATPIPVLNRPDTLLVITMAQLQKLAVNAHFDKAFQLGMDLLRLVDNLHDFTNQYSVKIVVKHLDQLLVATGGQVSTTHLKEAMPIWRVETAAHAIVWWLQNPEKPFEAITTSLIPLS